MPTGWRVNELGVRPVIGISFVARDFNKISTIHKYSKCYELRILCINESACSALCKVSPELVHAQLYSDATRYFIAGNFIGIKYISTSIKICSSKICFFFKCMNSYVLSVERRIEEKTKENVQNIFPIWMFRYLHWFNNNDVFFPFWIYAFGNAKAFTHTIFDSLNQRNVMFLISPKCFSFNVTFSNGFHKFSSHLTFCSLKITWQ